MRISLITLASTATIALFVAGCAGPEEKLGRGFNNTFEVARGGEMSRSIEQTSLFETPDAGYTTGVVRGFDKTLARTGLGIWEIVTFPLPNHSDAYGANYGPLATKYLTPTPSYPDGYKPGLTEERRLATDTALGFSGGDVAPWFPGSRFSVLTY